MNSNIFETKWENEPIIGLEYGEYQAKVIPGIGGNIIGLKKGDINILRKLTSLDNYKNAPGVYGMPILFPPNRIDGGKFELGGKSYQFKINETGKNNSLHGFVQDKAFEVVEKTANEDCARVVLRFVGDKETSFYQYFPHEFICQVSYTLNADGLLQEIKLINTGDETMPLGLGFHTAFDLGFAGRPEDVKLKVSVDQRIQLSERSLPTGEINDLTEKESLFRTEGQNPLYADMDDHFTAKEIMIDGKPFHGAVLENTETNHKIVYEVGEKYKHWMVWNCGQEGSFVCPEPQTWRVNAPNLEGTDEELGLYFVEPKQQFVEYTKVYCI